MIHKNSIREYFDELVKVKIKPMLKKHCFFCKDKVWNRKRGNFIDVVEINFSKSTTSDFVRFTVTCGIYIDEVNELIWGKKKRNSIREYCCLVRACSGELLEDIFINDSYDKKWTDTWWDIESKQEVEEKINLIEFFIRDKVLPFFDLFDSFEKIEYFMAHRKGSFSLLPLSKIQLAVLLILMGEIQTGQELLQGEINNRQGWPENALQVFQRLKEKGFF
jgi:hypothetical protein